jgi:thymidylate synthase (FAD)
MQEHTNKSAELYQHLLDNNVAPEIARCILPQSMMTEFVETGSLAAYARLYNLRTDPTAQKEIQIYAKKLGELIEPLFPVAWKALCETES